MTMTVANEELETTPRVLFEIDPFQGAVLGLEDATLVFYMKNATYMCGDKTYVWQTGVAGRELCDPTTSGCHEVVTLALDSSEQAQGRYQWLLTSTTKKGTLGYRVGLDVEQDSFAEVTQLQWDVQGCPLGEKSLQKEESQSVLSVLTTALRDPELQRSVQDKREARKRAEANVLNFQKTQVGKFGPALYEQKLKQLKENVGRAGLMKHGGPWSSLRPQPLSEEQKQEAAMVLAARIEEQKARKEAIDLEKRLAKKKAELDDMKAQLDIRGLGLFDPA